MQGHQRAWAIRFWTGKVLLGGMALYAGAYYFKYNSNDWTRKGGWKVMTSKKSVLPGEPGYPRVSDRVQPSDYAANGFKSSPI